MEKYFNENIAEVIPPKKIALASNPNFVTFESKIDKTEDQRMTATILILSYAEAGTFMKSNISILLKETKSGKEHIFKATYKPEEVNDKTFLLIDPTKYWDVDAPSVSTYNFRDCLLKNRYIRNNFDVTIPQEAPYFSVEDACTNVINIVSKGSGSQYDFQMAFAYEDKNAELPNAEPDIIIELTDKAFSIASDEEMFRYHPTRYHWGGLLPRIGQLFVFLGSLTRNDKGFFQIIKAADKKISEKEAKYRTLINLKYCLERCLEFRSTVYISVNKEKLCIECRWTQNLYEYRFSSLESFDDFGVVNMRTNQPNMEEKFVPVLCEGAPEGSEKKCVQQKNYGYECYFDKQSSYTSDTIDSGAGDRQIELEVYTDTGSFFGDYSGEDEVCETGTYIASLSKSYFGKPLWFDLNALIGKRSLYATDFLTQLEAEKDKKSWVDAGTMSDYRFVAKRTDKKVIEPFYFSDVLYSLNGYDYTLNEADMNAHVLKINQNFANDKFDIVKPLTTNLERTHVKGQRQYFNFVLKDEDHFRSGVARHQIGLIYKLYTQSGTFIGEKIDQKQESNVFNNVNTALLGLDQFLPAYNEKTVGRIDVALVASLDDAANGIRYENVVVSELLTYRILPTYLHKVNDFAFLNRLGGWDSFNFGGLSSAEFKTTASTVYKTLQPNFNYQTEIESVATKTTEEKRTVQTSPIPYHVVEWLREVSASNAVYELSSKRYIVVEEMALKYNSKDDLFQVEMKYHYSDTFNTKIK